MNLYDILGVDKKADGAAIKRAFRRKAQKAHPDRGGSDAEMSAVNRAYGILSDQVARERYDQRGEEVPRDPRADMLNELAKLLFGIVEAAANPESCDVIGMARGAIDGVIRKQAEQAEKFRASAKKLDRASTRFRRRKPTAGQDLVIEMLRFRAGEYAKAALTCEAAIEQQRKMLELLGEYEYVFETVQPQNMRFLTGQAAVAAWMSSNR